MAQLRFDLISLFLNIFLLVLPHILKHIWLGNHPSLLLWKPNGYVRLNNWSLFCISLNFELIRSVWVKCCVDVIWFSAPLWTYNPTEMFQFAVNMGSFWVDLGRFRSLATLLEFYIGFNEDMTHCQGC